MATSVERAALRSFRCNCSWVEDVKSAQSVFVRRGGLRSIAGDGFAVGRISFRPSEPSEVDLHQRQVAGAHCMLVDLLKRSPRLGELALNQQHVADFKEAIVDLHGLLKLLPHHHGLS